MSLKNILSLVWYKVFNFKITTISSVIFAVCFELARRFFDFQLWLAAIPAAISLICVLLILKRKFTPDTLSNIGAGALLISLLWISSTLSIDRLKPEHEKIIPRVQLIPLLASNKSGINFGIDTNITDAKDFLFSISPDKKFYSAGQINNVKSYAVIRNTQLDGSIDISVKYIENDNHESSTWHFSFNLNLERLKLYKQYVLSSKFPWLKVTHHDFNLTAEIRFDSLILEPICINCIESVVYSINNDLLDKKVNPIDYWKLRNKIFDYWVIHNTKDNDINSVSSKLIFKDGSESDIRISKIID